MAVFQMYVYDGEPYSAGAVAITRRRSLPLLKRPTATAPALYWGIRRRYAHKIAEFTPSG
ncbi:MAG: hypothetical protein ACREA2_07570 [Blastocatellia bacterium]